MTDIERIEALEKRLAKLEEWRAELEAVADNPDDIWVDPDE
jgi:hypothetical protein